MYDLHDDIPIAAVNLSRGGKFAGNCDRFFPSMEAMVARLRAAGIATVAAAGNNGYDGALNIPACLSSTISVGATNDRDSVATFSNNSNLVTPMAPGVAIRSSVPDDGYVSLSGTSMAVPHVSGAIAVLRSARPNASVESILAALTATGESIVDERGGSIGQRIDVQGALARIKVIVRPPAVPPRAPKAPPKEIEWVQPMVDLILS